MSCMFQSDDPECPGFADENQEILYHWNAQFLITMRDEHAVIGNPAPAPLTREQICEVFFHLGERSEYNGCEIHSHEQNGDCVIMRDGVIQPKED